MFHLVQEADPVQVLRCGDGQSQDVPHRLVETCRSKDFGCDGFSSEKHNGAQYQGPGQAQSPAKHLARITKLHPCLCCDHSFGPFAADKQNVFLLLSEPLKVA